MAFENEFASYEPLRRLLDSPKIEAFQKRLKINKLKPEEQDELLTSLVKKEDLPKSEWVPDMLLAIDGSFHAKKIENGFPGAEIGYITIASVLILLNKVRLLEKNEFIDPKSFRETEKASTIDSVFPGCNVILEKEKTAKASLRRSLFEELENNTIFSGGETLLDTYEALFKIKLDKGQDTLPLSPIEDVPSDTKMTYGFGQYACPHTKEPLYSTDATRLHELMNSGGTNGEMYGQIMQMLEKLWLVHVLRAFEKRGWLPTMRNMAFVMDGPLACFSTWSWLNKSIIDELKRINTLQKEINGQDLLIIGIEKSGTFYNHFENLDVSTDGVSDNFPRQSAMLLDDNYIKKNIIFSEGVKQYGQDVYFGRKFFYKTSSDHRLVPVVAFFDEKQQDLSIAKPEQFTRLIDVMNLLDQVASSRYPNSVSPLISAHAEAAIPLHLGGRIFEEIAREIRQRSNE